MSFRRSNALPKRKTENTVTGKMLEFLSAVAKPGFGALLMASKSAQWPMAANTPAKVAAARKPGN